MAIWHRRSNWPTPFQRKKWASNKEKFTFLSTRSYCCLRNDFPALGRLLSNAVQNSFVTLVLWDKRSRNNLNRLVHNRSLLTPSSYFVSYLTSASSLAVNNRIFFCHRKEEKTKAKTNKCQFTCKSFRKSWYLKPISSVYRSMIIYRYIVTGVRNIKHGWTWTTLVRNEYF